MLSCSTLKGAAIIRNTINGIELRNNIISLLISGDAKLLSCKEVASEEDIAARSHKKIASAKTTTGKTVEAKSVTLQGSILRIQIGEHYIDVKVDAYNNYFTFELLSDVSAFFSKVTFIDLKMEYDYSDSNTLLVAGVPMTLHTDPVFYPSGESLELLGRCTSHTGMLGAKLAAVICRENILKEILKEVYSSLPEHAVPASPYGGPFATESEYNKSNRLLISYVRPEDVQRVIDQCKEWDIKQLDFLLGARTFIQGDFSFPNMGSGQSFKQSITDPLKKAGIVSLMHTYSFYISYESTDLLSNPEWQQQLEFRNTSILAKTISATTEDIDLQGDMAFINNSQSFWSLCSPYVLIDSEIIRYSVGKRGYISCKRGQCGTTAVEHKAGAKVKIIGGRLSYIAPQPGSELFYEVARRTAKAYNEGGFKGFYFDALAGLSIHLEHAGLKDYLWYYGAAFINEVLKNCKDAPIVEYSTLYPTLWAARGRGGAWDTPHCSYKEWVDLHTSANNDLIRRMYVPTLGWYDLYPQDKKLPNGFATKYMFFDDVDYLGTKMIAYNQSMVFNGFSLDKINSLPALRRNLERFSNYSYLYQVEYFTPKVKHILQDSQYEYKLIYKNGRWGFREVVYNKSKIRDINSNHLIGINPFKRQKPFIRLENLFSSDCKSLIYLIQFKDNHDLSLQKTEKYFKQPLDLSNHLALRIKIMGNGALSNGALCIRLHSSKSTGYADYTIRTNFDGWREVILSDLDNAENPDLMFPDMDTEKYKVYRHPVDFSSINSVQVYMSGDCSGVRVKDIVAVPRVSNALKNPSVKLSNASITFEGNLKSGEFIEYQAGDNVATIFNSIGESRTVPVLRQGRFRIPHGLFEATVSGQSELQDTPCQVVATIGSKGRFITN